MNMQITRQSVLQNITFVLHRCPKKLRKYADRFYSSAVIMT